MQVQCRGPQRGPLRRRRMRRVAMHLWRLAEQHVHRQVDGISPSPLGRGVGVRGTGAGDGGTTLTFVAPHPALRATFSRREKGSIVQGAVAHYKSLFLRRHANGRERAALAFADRREFRQPCLRHAQHVAFLRFVAPQLHRRQRGIVAGHPAQVDHAAHAGVVQQFRDRVGQTARADVMEPQDRIVLAHRHAAVDDFLAAAFHLRVVALHAGEIQILGALARGDRTGRTATQADQHGRATQHDDGVAGRQRLLLHLDAVDRAQAAGQHDRLVVGAGQRLAFRQFEAAEIAQQVRPAELVVERGTAQRTVQHDVQCRRHARIQRARRLPGLGQRGNAQVRDREAGQAGLGLATPAGGAFVTDLAAGAGAGARERRDRRGVIVRFHLDAERRVDARLDPVLAAAVRTETRGRVAFQHGRVVAVGAERVLRRLRVGVLDHPEQGTVLLLAVDGPAGVEDLVPAVLGVGLREHHQLDVGRIAAQLGVACAQVVDLVLGQRQAQAHVRGLQLRQRDTLQFAARGRGEQGLRLLAAGEQGLRHRVVQRLGQRRRRIVPAFQVDAQAALDALHRLAGAAQQLRGLAGPRRQRAQARGDEAGDRAVRLRGIALVGLQDAPQRGQVRAGARVRLDEIDVPGAADTDGGGDGLELGFEPRAAEMRQGRLAFEDDHVREPWGRAVRTGPAIVAKPARGRLPWRQGAAPAAAAGAFFAASSSSLARRAAGGR